MLNYSIDSQEYINDIKHDNEVFLTNTCTLEIYGDNVYLGIIRSVNIFLLSNF